ncbi:beta-ketoacyl synthase N-terminal-like domain-containing protein [Nonomuraea sp. NPDC049725]|uniref:type I polyketide synthase n=1 Tax=Nonomuraea sp. NPDC049725 TaxID=3154508 RepID=UPI00343A940B
MTSDHIAVIGMAGRFPGAANVDQYWANLVAGVESIRRLTPEELAEAGVPERLRAHERYVPARGVVEGVDLFDAEYFGMSPREAQVTDPQQRLFLECVEEALQDAGYAPTRLRGPVGVFAGCTQSSYKRFALQYAEALELDETQIRVGTEPDFLTTRAAYRLHLTGPCVTVQTACSTGLVALHYACQSLLNGECEMAVAGAASILYPEHVGYLYQPGAIASPDGHCRAFDADAQGTVGGNGCAAVLLKPLERALADGDPIRAVVLGSAVNNDGARKVGFTAPGVRGQREVVLEALAVAGAEPASIGYLETHGTGTHLGDAVELEALAHVFGDRADPLVLGAVKPNIGHLDAAAGMAGFIKAVLVLENGIVPPTPHFTRPNPRSHLVDGPFEVPSRARAWPAAPSPRRAGVSSFGVGGTNAHAVLAEFAEPAAPADESGTWHILPISARDEGTLLRYGGTVQQRLSRSPDLPFGSAAYTMQTGRRELDHRIAVVAEHSAQAERALAEMDAGMIVSGRRGHEPPRIAFTFPGQGTEFRGMARDLSAGEPTFARHLADCLEALPPATAERVSGFLTGDGLLGGGASPISTDLAQPALFAFQYALARTWLSWGIRPTCLLGHSLGELTAATISGALTLRGAAMLVTRRGELMSAAPGGAMLAVLAAAERVEPLLQPGVTIAAVNSPRSTVVAGPAEAVARMAGPLAAEGLTGRPLRTEHAFHTAAMDEAAARFRAVAAEYGLRRPDLPFVSNVTGDWITDEQVTDPGYWAGQLRHPVRFAGGFQRLVDAGVDIVLEVGPGRSLTTLARDLLTDPAAGPRPLASLPGRAGISPRQEQLARTAAELWVAGAELDWDGMRAGRDRRRVRMPAYPFNRRRYTLRDTGPQPGGEQGDEQGEEHGRGVTDGRTPSRHRHPRPGLSAPYRAPAPGLQARLAGLFEDVLGIAGVGADDDFLELGGDSLMAIRLVARVGDHFPVEVSGAEFFRAPTVAGLADHLGGLLEAAVAGMEPETVAALLRELEGDAPAVPTE